MLALPVLLIASFAHSHQDDLFAQTTTVSGPRLQLVDPWSYVQDKKQDTKQEEQEKKPPRKWHVKAGALFSLNAEVEKLDPFYGVGVFYRDYTTKTNFWEVGADVYFGGGKEEVCSSGICAEDEFDDRLYWIYGNFGAHFVEDEAPLGWSGWLGIGIGIERGEGEVTVGGTTIDFEVEAEAFSIQAGFAYETERVQPAISIIWFPGSDNVTLASVLSLSIRF
jgi:hypothetical protein